MISSILRSLSNKMISQTKDVVKVNKKYFSVSKGILIPPYQLIQILSNKHNF
ncbi:hypothetical protein FLAN108750_00695 [Flavobacterium antarcticum]